jgi:hypothetical protein
VVTRDPCRARALDRARAGRKPLEEHAQHRYRIRLLCTRVLDRPIFPGGSDVDNSRPNPYILPAGLVPRYARDEPDRLLPSEAVRGYTPVQVARPAKPELVPSADGRIAQLLFTLPSYALDPSIWSVYQDLWTKLPDDAQLVVLAHASIAEDVDAGVEGLGLSPRCTLLSAPDEINFSIWAEDGYVFARGDGAGYFVEPFLFRRRGDALVADLVTNGTDLRMYQAPLYFQGGNVLVGDDFWMIGADYVRNTIRLGVLDIPSNASPDEQLAAVTSAYRTYLDHRRTPRSSAAGSTCRSRANSRLSTRARHGPTSRTSAMSRARGSRCSTSTCS